MSSSLEQERGIISLQESVAARKQGIGPEWLGKPTDEDVFRLYTLFCGDVGRTAHACEKSEDEVRELVRVNRWDDKIKTIIDLKNAGRGQDVERAVNRAINFIQAHKLRLLLEEIIRNLVNKGGATLAEECYTSRFTKQGTVTQLNLRPFADLASALEKCHALCYMALDDSSTDRRERARSEGGDGLEITATEMHMKLAHIMAGPLPVSMQKPPAAPPEPLPPPAPEPPPPPLAPLPGGPDACI